VELDVGVAHAGAAADETAGLEVVARPQAVVGHEPAQPDEGLAQRRGLPVERYRFAAGHLKVELQMILKVLSHAKTFMHERDAVLRKLARRADA